MSLTSVLAAAASSLRLNAGKVAASADNVVNVDTAGYKAATVEGVPVATGGRQDAVGGVTGVLRPAVSVQGLLAASGSLTDLVISGDGFVPVETPTGARGFARGGLFQSDSEGFLADPAGNRLLAHALDTAGQPRTGELEPVNITAANNVALQEDGTPGEVTGTNIANDGTVEALLANGDRRAVYRIPVALFANPNGLHLEQGNVYMPTHNSGNATLRTAGRGRAGHIQSGAREVSTVDLASEYVRQTLAQTAYNAGIETLRTGEEMLRELVDVKR